MPSPYDLSVLGGQGSFDPGVSGLPALPTPQPESRFQQILSGLLGPGKQYGGLLDPAMQQQIKNQTLLNIGANLLASSRNGQGLGANAGQAILGAQQSKQQSIDDQIRNMTLLGNLEVAKKSAEKDLQPASVQEYEYAKANGYAGSFDDWKTSGRIAAQQDPAAIQEYNFYSKLPPEQKKEFLQIKRGQVAGTVTDIQGSPSLVNRVTGDVQQLSTPQLEQQAAGANAQAVAVGTGRGQAASNIETKQPAADSMEYVLSKFDEQIPKTTQGGVGGIKGKAGAVTDYEDATRFDNLKEQLSTELRTVYRIPGEGTLSDREQAQYGIQLPNRNNSAKVNQQIISDLRARTKLRLPQQAGGRGASGSFDASPAPGAVNRVRVDANGNVVK